MHVPRKLHAETPSRPRARSAGAELPAMKQRKVNSEVRKQQNRIASRNYREKRKQKLQQLQHLLEDDVPGESQIHTRSTSPDEGHSYSGSSGYERSLASSSPHISTVSGNFESPQPDHSAIVGQTWSTSVIPSIEQTFMYTHPHPAMYQQPTFHSMSTAPTTSYPVWSTMPSTVSTGYTTSASAQEMAYPSHPSLWSSSGYRNLSPDSVHQHMAVPDTASYTPSWQYRSSSDLPSGIAIDPYGRRYYTYNPS